MSLQQIKNLNKQKGFTIVELLIVIVVIGILAAIVIVAFNGVQNRAKTQAGNTAASTVQKKIEAYNAASTSGYPTTTVAATLKTNLDSIDDSKITGINLVVPTALSSTNGQNSVGIEVCNAPAGATGYRLSWFDFSGNAAVAAASRITVLTAGTCTGWVNAT